MDAILRDRLGVEGGTQIVLVLDSGGSTTPQQYCGQLTDMRYDSTDKPYAVQLRGNDDMLMWFNYDRVLRWYEVPASGR